jgi:hypothetical protein
MADIFTGNMFIKRRSYGDGYLCIAFSILHIYLNKGLSNLKVHVLDSNSLETLPDPQRIVIVEFYD